MAESIKLTHAALDEVPGGKGEIILRGVLDPKCLDLLKVDHYQREILPQSKIDDLMLALTDSSVPDIELGMRGGKFMEREGAFYLQSSVYIVDGLQRISAARELMKKEPGATPRIGATVYFNTSEPWERARFKTLNAERTKLSPNVLIRNMRKDLEVIETLHNLSGSDKVFVLAGRVCWQQRMNRHELISALTFLKTIGHLHAHIGPGKSNVLDEVARGLETIMERVGKNVLRDNVRTFFGLVDMCWGIRRITYKETAVYVRSSFLRCLARLLSNHHDFWRDENEHRLFIEAPLVRKLALFPVNDPQVVNLASAGGKAQDLLYMLMRDHVNSGKRSKRLRSRVADEDVSTNGDMPADETTD